MINYEDPRFLSYYDLRLAMAKAIEERGEEYVYAKDPRWGLFTEVGDGEFLRQVPPICSYTRQDQDTGEMKFACAVGAIWDKTGIISLEEAETIPNDSVAEVLSNSWFSTDSRGHRYLMLLQHLQDKHYPWGYAEDLAVKWSEGEWSSNDEQLDSIPQHILSGMEMESWGFFWPYLDQPLDIIGDGHREVLLYHNYDLKETPSFGT